MGKLNILIGVLILLVILSTQAVLAVPAWKQQPSTPATKTAIEPQVIYVNQTVETPQEGGINWEMIGVIIAVLAGIIGWIVSLLVRGKTAKYMTDIDKAYQKYKQNTNKCEAELTNLREKIDDDFKKGKLTDQALSILEKRIDKYSRELRSNIIDSRFDLPKNIHNDIRNMLADGVITKDEYSHFRKVIGKANLGAGEKAELNRIMKRWKDSDKK